MTPAMKITENITVTISKNPITVTETEKNNFT